MNRSLRIAAVTGGLLVAGAVAGAVAAEAAFLVASLFDHSGGSFINRDSLIAAGSVGALLGGVLLPITAWIFLRRVPLGLAVLGTLLGTVVGGALGWVFLSGGDPVQYGLTGVYTLYIRGGLNGAFVGFALSALLLRLLASAPRVPRAVSTRG
jgi:hypothetical protein